jgi:serine/threonine-protein kinase HipA
MSINGKRNGFERQDFLDVAKQFRIKKPLDVLAEVGAAVSRWSVIAEEVGIDPKRITTIASTHRLGIVV